ncbi:MAG TPA: alkaline phosphatase PhoX [Nocardioidaceae bacterium]|nr:alkaline phosphatase PhoX [Nocardioidaceae bacterium]
MSVERRTVLKSAAAATVAGPFAGLLAAPAGAAHRPPRVDALVPIKDKRDGVVRLHLPKGFSYRSFHDTEQTVTLTDGTVLPGRHDGMGAFVGPDDTVILVRNHELNNPPPALPPGNAFGGPNTPAPYDARALGGTTTIQTTKQGEVIRSFTSLNGTMMNCSGGIMPWGSWVTCEETVNGPDVGKDFTNALNTALQQPHGFIFEVPASVQPGGGQSNRQPIRNAGRFSHEAVSFDPVHNHLYLTEDNFAFPSGFYRYRPPSNAMEVGRLDDGGTLEMLKVVGVNNAHLEAHQVQGATYDVEWKVIEEPWREFPYTPGEPAPTPNDTALQFVGSQGHAQGTAFFSRLEGQVFDNGVVFFTSTQGGGAAETGPELIAGFGNGSGQVWAYDTNTSKLRCVFQSSGPLVLDFPDNVTTSPSGTLVVCEDNNADNFLRGLTPDGELWDIALNRLRSSLTGADRSNDEFAGSTFSPDGHTLFVNIQAGRGMSFAIWGPWASIGV